MLNHFKRFNLIKKMEQRKHKHAKLLQWQIDYIIAHADESRRKVAATIGVSDVTVRVYLHRFAPEKIKDMSAIGNEVERLYPTMLSTEIAAVLGCTPSNVCTLAARRGVRHNENTLRRIRAANIENIKKAVTPEVLARRAARQRRLFKMERLRILSGEPQKTRRKFRTIPINVKAARNRIIRLGYCLRHPDGDGLTLLITPACRPFPKRRDATESHYVQKYGFKFVHTDEEPAASIVQSVSTASIV